jgi:hypothetical protein
MIIKSFVSNKSFTLYNREGLRDEVVTEAVPPDSPINIDETVCCLFIAALPYNDLIPISPSPCLPPGRLRKVRRGLFEAKTIPFHLIIVNAIL